MLALSYLTQLHKQQKLNFIPTLLFDINIWTVRQLLTQTYHTRTENCENSLYPIPVQYIPELYCTSQHFHPRQKAMQSFLA